MPIQLSFSAFNEVSLAWREDSEDGLRAGCLPAFPFSPLSPLSSAKTLSPHPTNSFSIRMSAEIPDRKRLPSSFPTRFKSIFLRDFGLTLLFLRGLMFRKRVPTCTVCIDCLPQCPLTYLWLYWVPKHEQVIFLAPTTKERAFSGTFFRDRPG